MAICINHVFKQSPRKSPGPERSADNPSQWHRRREGPDKRKIRQYRRATVSKSDNPRPVLKRVSRRNAESASASRMHELAMGLGQELKTTGKDHQFNFNLEQTIVYSSL